ncbi:MAG: hypothetical protein CMB80_01775 [Flammeovirgaceae bacterium]|nr:hypothetical protein [Flammeovirgaceae bacterium]
MNKTIISILLIITVGAPLFIAPNIYSVFDLSKITFVYILTFILIGIWAVRGTVPHRNILTYPVLAVLFSSIIATVFAIHPFVSFAGTYKRYGGLMSLVVYIVIFYAVVEFVKKSDIQKFLNAVIITASVAAVYSFIQYSNLDPYNWSIDFGYDGRPSATFGHPTFFSAYMAMTVPLVIYGIMKGKYWLYPVAGLLMYALFLSKTRAGFIGLVVAMIYLFVLAFIRIKVRTNCHRYIFITIFAGVIIGLNVFMPNSPIKRFQAEYKEWNMEGNIGYRVQMAMTCLDIIKDNSVVGIGMDNLAYKYSEYYQKRYKKDEDRYNNRAHNAILEVLATQGIIGLLAWLYIIVIYFHMVYKNRQDLMVITLSSCVVAYMAQNMFTFGGIGITPLFWMLMGMTVVQAKKDYDFEVVHHSGGYTIGPTYEYSAHG